MESALSEAIFASPTVARRLFGATENPSTVAGASSDASDKSSSDEFAFSDALEKASTVGKRSKNAIFTAPLDGRGFFEGSGIGPGVARRPKKAF